MNIEILRLAVMDSRDGITISDNGRPDNPLIFVNPAFERMTGYSQEESINKNCRYLQGKDREQPAIKLIRDALEQGDYCLTTVRNYRKNGSPFWNELSISPIFNELGGISHFIGIQKDVTARVTLEQKISGEILSLEVLTEELQQLAILDGLTGIYNRRFFDAQLDIQSRIAHRQGLPLTLMMIDIDHFKLFNDQYGHLAGDTAIRKVAQGLSSGFARASDFVARYGGEEFAILATDMPSTRAARFAQSLCDRVRELDILHDSSPTGRLTISVGFAVHSHDSSEGPNEFVDRADKALYRAKQSGRNQYFGEPLDAL